MPIQAGSRLGPYELTAPIGAGGMGEVWRAKDTRLDRSVAVKILPAAFAEDEERRQRFEREEKTISSLNHPHICTLFDVGHEGDVHFLVMELLEGETLADRLQKGPLPLDQVVKFGAEVAEALSAAHRQGIVHRDLKPGNGFMPDGRSVLYSEQNPDTNWDLRVVTLGEKQESRVLLSTPFDEQRPEVSPDGRWVAYTSNETGRGEICVRPLAGSFEQWQVSAAGGSQPRWRGDGRELYYVAPDGLVMAASIETQPVFRPGTPRKLFQLPERPDRLTPIFADVTPDGRRFLLSLPVRARSSVGFHVVLNWRSLLDSRGE